MSKTPERQAPRGNKNMGRFAPIEKAKDTKATLKKIFKYVVSYKEIIIPMLIAVVFTAVTSVLSNYFVKDVVKSFGSFNSDLSQFGSIDPSTGETINLPDQGLFTKSIILLASFYFVNCLSSFFTNLFSALVSCRLLRDIRNDCFGKIVFLPIRYIDTHPHGDIMSRITNDSSNLSNGISQSLSSLVNGILTIVGCLVIMLINSPLLTLISLVVLVLTLIFSSILTKVMKPLYKKQQEVLGDLNTDTEEMVTGCKTVIAYNRQELAIKEFNEHSEKLRKLGTKAQIISGSMGPVMNFIGNFGYFLISVFGAIFAIKNIGNVSIDVVIMFLSTTKQFTRPINEIAQLFGQLVSSIASAERCFELLDEEQEDFSKEEDFDPKTIEGVIDFEHVRFGYVPEKVVLKDFNVDIRSGHKIALVGATGSGKTTIVNLLLRFYDIDSGKISIDGKDISKISKKDLRDSISIVLQDPVLFGDTIENNVRYAREDATDEEVDNALHLANCDRLISRFSEGKKTMLTEGATNISQGQRQLLTIARAVLADPKILILDEATSSVDTRTEKKIQDAMVKLMENRTSIIIAHRLSTIQDADLILVLDNGEIKEMGNHEELIAKDGIYNRLYQTQFKGLQI